MYWLLLGIIGTFLSHFLLTPWVPILTGSNFCERVSSNTWGALCLKAGYHTPETLTNTKNYKEMLLRAILIGYIHTTSVINQFLFATIFLKPFTALLQKVHMNNWLYIFPAATGSDRFSDKTALTHYWGKELSLPVPAPIFADWSHSGQSLTLWSVEWALPEHLNCLRLFPLESSV